jgi:thiamine-phosphate pyrophosphorylase
LRPRPPRVYAIADAEALAPRALADGVAEMAQAGVEWIQLRTKRLADRELFREAEASCRAVEGTPAALWIDDRPDLAAMLPVAGVHLGQADLPPVAARPLVGSRWIGQSTHDEEQLRAAEADPEVDLVAVGPVFPTGSKAAAGAAVGVEWVRRARALTGKPLVAIGGIDGGTLRAVLAAGADSVAMIGALCRGDVADNCRRLLAAAEEDG